MRTSYDITLLSGRIDSSKVLDAFKRWLDMADESNKESDRMRRSAVGLFWFSLGCFIVGCLLGAWAVLA
jgi:hypothetical protein